MLFLHTNEDLHVASVSFMPGTKMLFNSGDLAHNPSSVFGQAVLPSSVTILEILNSHQSWRLTSYRNSTQSFDPDHHKKANQNLKSISHFTWPPLSSSSNELRNLNIVKWWICACFWCFGWGRLLLVLILGLRVDGVLTGRYPMPVSSLIRVSTVRNHLLPVNRKGISFPVLPHRRSDLEVGHPGTSI